MILDELTHGHLYPLGPAWKKACDFLAGVQPTLADGEYKLQGQDVIARVMSYATRPRDSSLFETHREYVDVQSVLAGDEDIEWAPRASLSVSVPYDAAKDAEIYQRPSVSPARLRLCPGLFAIFLPPDAHMPSVMAGSTPQPVKKVVVKIRVACIPGR
jgi:YhcH/YjgK/YiaL family protein